MNADHRHWLALAGLAGFLLLTGICAVVHSRGEEMTDLPAITPEEFEQLKEAMRAYRKWCDDNKPPPIGDYQWEYGYLNGGFGGYTALFYKGKKIGGLFEAGSFANEYHRFSEDGGVYSEKSMPPVGFPETRKQ